MMPVAEIMERVKNGQTFVQAMQPPGGLTPDETADWQIICNAAIALIHQIRERCPDHQTKLEAVMFAMRTMAMVNGAFVVKTKGNCGPCSS